LLRNLQNDPRWNTMIVPGSSSTLSQLWTAWAGSGINLSEFVDPGLELDPTAERGPSGNDPGNRDRVLKNRRAGMWYKSVCRMAHNASMKSAFYDAILSTWPDCRVFNYADVGYEHRLTQGEERLRWRFERVSTAATTWNDDQWTLPPSLTSDGLLGVRNVYQQPMTYLDRGCSGNPLADAQTCDAAAFPVHLYPEPTISGDRIDQWHIDAPSLANNGKDLPGTDASPVFYGVAASQEQIDVNLPWLKFYDNCGDPATCSPPSYEFFSGNECRPYWREGLLRARDVSDAIFFSGYEAGNRIPWIPAPGTLTFPADGGDRPNCPLLVEDPEGTGLLDYMAFLRATNTTDAMVFFSEPGTSLNSCASPGPHLAWASTDDARTRAYAAQLVDINVTRGYHDAGTIADARDIVPSPLSNLPQSFIVQSKFVTDDELFKFAHLCEVEFTVEVTRPMLNEMLAGGIKPRLFLETYVDGDEAAVAIDRAPIRMMAQLQIEVLDNGTRKFKMWSVGDRDIWGAQSILPENWFHFYTPDRSMRRTFDETITQTHDSFIDVGTDPDAPGIVRMKLIVRNKSGETTPFRLHIDRFQLAFIHAGSIGGSAGGGTGFAQGSSTPPLADANRSGVVNEVDIMVFATDAAANEPAADLDQDGLVTGADVSAFFEAYSTEVQ
ncbi:MAG: hypothetical protein NTV94_11560, partial [Planctomycetota bacterium]|nr:hypothetical protein [Planctomycetota bacterium]